MTIIAEYLDEPQSMPKTLVQSPTVTAIALAIIRAQEAAGGGVPPKEWPVTPEIWRMLCDEMKEIRRAARLPFYREMERGGIFVCGVPVVVI